MSSRVSIQSSSRSSISFLISDGTGRTVKETMVLSLFSKKFRILWRGGRISKKSLISLFLCHLFWTGNKWSECREKATKWFIGQSSFEICWNCVSCVMYTVALLFRNLCCLLLCFVLPSINAVLGNYRQTRVVDLVHLKQAFMILPKDNLIKISRISHLVNGTKHMIKIACTEYSTGIAFKSSSNSCFTFCYCWLFILPYY